MLREIQITEQPVSACVPADYTLTLRCRAESDLSLQYQWYQQSEQSESSCCQIPGATQSELHITARESHVYICRVNDRYNNFQFSRWVKVKVLHNVTKALLPVQWQGEPIIVLNSSSSKVPAGKSVCLKCSALGFPAPDYQWYHNGQAMSQKKRSKLLIDSVKLKYCGTYLCCVKNNRGEHWSDPMEITIDDEIAHRTSLSQSCPRVPPVPDACYATDKVALLVGNNNYTHHPNLLAPMMDVFELTVLLKQLNFRVVSLLDLTKDEMLTAVGQFLQLLGKGVYALFYYAGHGYEHPGRNYMVPIDAPQPYLPENCISVQKILQRMQERKTALNVVLLDTCRKWYNHNRNLSELKPLEPMGNTVYGYATSEDAEAYEVQDGELSSGIFMKYLKKHILKEKKVNLVLDDVLEDIGRDHLVTGKQAMEIKHTLIEPRSLCDKICTTGHTHEFQARNKLWVPSTELPKQSLKFPCGVEVELTFHTVFSNIMHVCAKLKWTPPQMADVRVLLCIPLEMTDLFRHNVTKSERIDSLLVSANNRVESDCMLRLCGLQNCKDDMIVQIDLHYTRLDTKQRVHERLHHNLKRPHVAQLFNQKTSAMGPLNCAEAASCCATASSSASPCSSATVSSYSNSCANVFSSSSSICKDRGAVSMYHVDLCPLLVNTELTAPDNVSVDHSPKLLSTRQSKLFSEPEENDEGET
ncbi:mucosa-associated lymphoid tissue lymphoma translocation protein 1-like [Lissotriton helveticus]